MAVMSPKEFATATPSWWCPGCGDFGVLSALKSALAELALQPKDVAFVSGIGCSGKISGYLHSYAFHGVHGRALPVATAVSLRIAISPLSPQAAMATAMRSARGILFIPSAAIPTSPIL